MNLQDKTQGTIWGVGIGPGDPDLMSLKADRLLRKASHVAYFRKAGRMGQARRIVDGMLRADVTEIALEYPVTTEIPLSDPRYNELLSAFYEKSAARLRAVCEARQDVVLVSEGDPFFYGSFMHLYTRLKGECPIEVVPAVTGMSAAWTATGVPMTWGDDVLSVLMGTMSETTLIEHMARADALVIMKVGRNLERICNALRRAGRFDAAWLVEYATMPDESVQKLSEVGDKVTPYFSIIIVHGNGRRP
ncbi:MAG: precorrin-2 C(20)-methyltransferase [Candidatus Phaeomarinobacter sp.]